MQSEFGPNTLRCSNPLLSELWPEYPSTKMLNVHIKKHLNKKSSLKDFRLPQTFENLLADNTASTIYFTLCGIS